MGESHEARVHFARSAPPSYIDWVIRDMERQVAKPRAGVLRRMGRAVGNALMAGGMWHPCVLAPVDAAGPRTWPSSSVDQDSDQ